MKLSETYQRKLITLAKVIIAAATLGFIGYKLLHNNPMQQHPESYLPEWNSSNLQLLIGTLLLIIPNLLLEGLKWRLLIRQHENISWLQAFQSVTAGIALGIITPNRIGELPGKALFLHTYDKIKGAMVSFITSIAQTLSMMVYGAIGVWMIAQYLYPLEANIKHWGILVVVVLGGLLHYLFLNLHWLLRFIKWSKVIPYIDAVSHYSKKQLATLLFFSWVRTFVFNVQYFLLLLLFNVEIDAYQALPALACIFFIQLFIPSFILVEMGVRGASALFFLGLFSTHTQGILIATYSLWILNIMFPALIGLYFILKLKWRTSS